MIEKTYQPGAVETRICEPRDLSGVGALDEILKLLHPFRPQRFKDSA
jgi:hypothetical protein